MTCSTYSKDIDARDLIFAHIINLVQKQLLWHGLTEKKNKMCETRCFDPKLKQSPLANCLVCRKVVRFAFLLISRNSLDAILNPFRNSNVVQPGFRTA